MEPQLFPFEGFLPFEHYLAVDPLPRYSNDFRVVHTHKYLNLYMRSKFGSPPFVPEIVMSMAGNEVKAIVF